MSYRFLLTGASGYLGGSLLDALSTANLPVYDKLFALVRTDSQAQSVTKYGAEPIFFDPFDEASTRKAILDNDITIVFYLIDAFAQTGQVNLIKALGELKRTRSRSVHFLHTTGAKIFSSHAGAPTNRPLYDNDPNLFAIHKAQKAPIPMMQTTVTTNTTITELANSLGVHSYIFAPCVVYGPGRGFANTISIQTVAIVRAALGVKRVYAPDRVEEGYTWPVCHIDDNTSLYVAILRGILEGGKSTPPSGERGFYLASSGSVRWVDLYRAMAGRLTERGVVGTSQVVQADDQALAGMGKALGCGPELVGLQVGGLCTFTARNGEEALGWKPRYGSEHALEGAGEEVDLILGVLREKGEVKV